MQRIFNLSKWQELVSGQAVYFDNPKPRVVRLEVNAANDGNLYVIWRDALRMATRRVSWPAFAAGT